MEPLSERRSGLPGVWLFATLAAAILMVVLALRTGVFDIDEGFYAAVTREMIRTGDYLIPRFGPDAFLEKPPLLYWLMAFFLKLGFTPVLAVRLPSIIAATVTLGMVGGFASRRGAGTLPVIALTLSILFLGLGHMAFTDMLLTCFLSATFLLFWLSISGSGQWLRIPAAACLGLAVLTKGPAAAVLFVLVAGATALFQPQLRSDYKRYWFESVLVFVAVAAPWYFLIYKKLGKEFLQEFVLVQNIGRLRGVDAPHVFPIYLYVLVLLLGFFPWSLYLPWLARRTRGDPFLRYCWIWFWVVFILFTISRTKLPSYILPLFPAAALLLSTVEIEIADAAAASKTWLKPLAWGFAFAVVFAVAMLAAQRFHGVPPAVGSSLWTCGVILVAGIVIAAASLRFVRPEVARLAAPLLVGGTLTLPLIFLVVPAWYEVTQAGIRAVSVAARSEVEQGTPYMVYAVTHPGHPSISFEINAPPIFGGALDDVRRELKRRPRLIVIAPATAAADLRALGAKPIAAEGDYIAVRFGGEPGAAGTDGARNESPADGSSGSQEGRE